MSHRNTTRRRLLQGVGLGLTSAVLLGCNSESERSSSSNTIRYWTFLDSNDRENPRAAAQAQILDLFREKHPDIHVEEEVVPWPEIYQQLLQAGQAGQAPDVCRLLDQHVNSAYRAGAIEPVSEFSANWTDEDRARFVYDWNDVVIDGEHLGFRHAIRPSNLLYYRTDIFAEAGFELPPTTHGELMDACLQMDPSDVYGFVLPFSRADGFSSWSRIQPMYWDMGSDLIDPESGNPTFNSEAGVQIFTWFQELVEHGIMPSEVATMDLDATDQLFRAGRVASTLHNSARYSQWREWTELEGRLETAPSPNWADAPKPGHAQLGNGWVLVMGTGADKDAAWQFMQFMHSPEAELIDAQVGGELPTNRQTYEADFFSSTDGAEMMDLYSWVDESRHAATITQAREFETLASELYEASQEIIVNNVSVTDALDAAAERYASAI